MNFSKNLALFAFFIVLNINERHCEQSSSSYFCVKQNEFTDIKCGHSYSSLISGSDKPIAWGQYENKAQVNGFSQLEIFTNSKYNDSTQAYYAGETEGFLTWRDIDAHWLNILGDYCNQKDRNCSEINEFIQENNKFIEKMIETNENKDTFWHQVSLIYHQIRGIQDGYNQKTNGSGKANVLWMNLLWELDEIAALYSNVTPHFAGDHCSAIIKLPSDKNDLFVSHVMWYTFNFMTRIVKRYNFAFHQTNELKLLVPAQTITHTSYPGAVFSFDDFYITSAGLAIQETTNDNYNRTAREEYLKPNKIVFEFARNMLANRLSNSGSDWVKNYRRYQSGTYNNQFMIIDFKKFPSAVNKSLPVSNGLLTIMEQMPGVIVTKDVTDVLLQQGYWASYNVPYFEKIYKVSGYEEKRKKFGDYYSYSQTSRAQIFKRDQKKVHDFKTLYNLMRYNDFKNDDLSRCNCTPPYSATLAIAARSDLNDPNGKYPINDLGYEEGGALDVKMTSFKMFNKNMGLWFESGPTRVEQPAFQWSNVKNSTMRHVGQPDKWIFPLMEIKWNQDHV